MKAPSDWPVSVNSTHGLIWMENFVPHLHSLDVPNKINRIRVSVKKKKIPDKPPVKVRIRGNTRSERSGFNARKQKALTGILK